MLVHLAEHIESVSQNLVAFEFRLGPVRSPLFDLKRVPISEILAKPLHGLAEHALRLALIDFERANLVNQVVEHVAHVHCIEHSESEVNGELQSWFARGEI